MLKVILCFEKHCSYHLQGECVNMALCNVCRNVVRLKFDAAYPRKPKPYADVCSYCMRTRHLSLII
jgi:hypothetical protein